MPVCVQRASDLSEAIARAADLGDIIELRLDCFPEEILSQASNEIRALLKSRSRPTILTLRPAEFGGARAISLGDRLFYRLHYAWIHSSGERGTDLWDLEADLALVLQQRDREGNDLLQLGVCDWTKTICSYHDFVGVPSDLEQIYQEMAATPARIVKIAAQADDAVDCLPVFHLLARAGREGREMIAIAMGPAGIVTRILGPSRGSFLTYGSLDDESATAPGQLTARELREVYRIDQIDRQTEITGLIGCPVGHSISPHIHNAAFAASNVNAVFIPFEVRDVHGFMRRMVRESSRELDLNFRGFSVTAPHKTAVVKHLDWIEPAAREIGAVNTIVVQDGGLHGYNTDASAFIDPLKGRFDSFENVRCAVIGAGGAGRAAIFALQQAGASCSLFARDVENAKLMVAKFRVDARDLAEADFEGFDVVVNATPLGTRGKLEAETPATAAQLRGVRLAYDLVYNPVETQFIREARAAGCETLGGLEMLVAQAVEQFKLWTNTEPDVATMRVAAERKLGTG